MSCVCSRILLILQQQILSTVGAHVLQMPQFNGVTFRFHFGKTLRHAVVLIIVKPDTDGVPSRDMRHHIYEFVYYTAVVVELRVYLEVQVLIRALLIRPRAEYTLAAMKWDCRPVTTCFRPIKRNGLRGLAGVYLHLA